MKRILSVIVTLAFVAASVPGAAVARSHQEAYIARYSAIAVSEMYRSGVPASITLAQGLLESGYGRSELALKSNNHFGIKCHNAWKGDKVYHDDDMKGECFRKYDTPEESFRDHSDFLRYRDRYKFLFDFKPTDYKSWAYGLKKAGYATDPSYPVKLIRLIEDYRLYEYDRRQEEKSVSLPEPPSQMEQSRPITQAQREQFHFVLTRPMHTMNGVPFVYSIEGETYKSIASSHDLFLREILRFNDLDE